MSLPPLALPAYLHMLCRVPTHLARLRLRILAELARLCNSLGVAISGHRLQLRLPERPTGAAIQHPLRLQP